MKTPDETAATAAWIKFRLALRRHELLVLSEGTSYGSGPWLSRNEVYKAAGEYASVCRGKLPHQVFEP